jgi:nucleoid-associated protein YgaU
VGKGDTLGKLAAKYYGKASKWDKILAANPQLGKDGKKLALGMKLTIPE